MRVKNEKKEPLFNTKKRILLYIILSLAYLAIVLIWGLVMNAESYGVDYGSKFVAPCKEHLFGTDYMGRDMFFRSIMEVYLESKEEARDKFTPKRARKKKSKPSE